MVQLSTFLKVVKGICDSKLCITTILLFRVFSDVDIAGCGSAVQIFMSCTDKTGQSSGDGTEVVIEELIQEGQVVGR